MRKCIRCQGEMQENYGIKVSKMLSHLVITESEKPFSKRLEAPKVAICPRCGEVSFYFENTEKLRK